MKIEDLFFWRRISKLERLIGEQHLQILNLTSRLSAMELKTLGGAKRDFGASTSDVLDVT